MLTGMPVLPVLLVTRAAAQHDVQHNDGREHHTADADRHVERREVAVDCRSLVWIVQVLGALLDRRHIARQNRKTSESWNLSGRTCFQTTQ